MSASKETRSTRSYSYIPDDKKQELVSLVIYQGYSIVKVSKQLKVNYSAAKSYVKI